MHPDDKLKELGITLPELPKPLGSYVPFVRSGNLILVSGMLPLKEGRLICGGRVGETVSLDQAILAARTAAINGIAVLKSATASLGAWRAGSGAAALLLLAGAFRVARSERVFVAARDDLGAQARACRLDAGNLPACVMAAWLRGTGGDLAGARAGLAAVLERAPHYPPAVKLLAQQALLAGDREAACVYMAAYEALCPGRSSRGAEFLGRCDEATRERARRRVPSPFYERFPLAGDDAR